jgi:two-component system nitrate/nitrite response regulator NarL
MVDPNHKTLTPRERDIMALYADGLTHREIAGVLNIQPKTVTTHTQNALRRLGVHTIAHAVATLLREGTIL